jgi:pimeloyl-ACP methyl ester carboxylesterase
LAYEYLKRLAERKDDILPDEGCLSVILSSSPCNVKQVEDEAGRLIEQLETPELFRETHQCRMPEMPDALKEAYDKAGTVWRGTTAISDYVATSPSEDAARMPICMVMRGEHDFVTEACVEDWRNLFNSRSVRYKTLDGCSHHGLLENPAVYGDIVDSFYAEYD